ncbi:unnamed protein product [Symbiodinium sp. KB8]|nr:unnamed protein product [Symbiodinium sp. KB8]
MKGRNLFPVGVTVTKTGGTGAFDTYLDFEEVQNDSHFGVKLSQMFFGLDGDKLTQCNTQINSRFAGRIPFEVPLTAPLTSSEELDYLYRTSQDVDCVTETIYPIGPRQELVNTFNALTAPFGNYTNNTYPFLAPGVIDTLLGDSTNSCARTSLTKSWCNELVGMEPTCPTKFNGTNRNETCAFDSVPIYQGYFDRAGLFGIDNFVCGADTYTLCNKIQWDASFRRDCCMVGGTPDIAWSPPSSHAFAQQHAEESYKWYCDPSWNTNDGLGNCADIMVEECTMPVDIPNQPGKKGSALLYEPSCKAWYDKLREDTRAMLDFEGQSSHQTFDGITDPTTLNTSLNLRWAAVENIVSTYCTSPEGRDSPECSCYLYNGVICDGVPPGQPCTFVMKVQPNANPPQRGTGICTDHVRANLATYSQDNTDDITALSLEDFVCGAACDPDQGKLLTQAQFVRHHGCPPRTCYQVINECIDIGTIKTQGLVNIADATQQCTGPGGVIDAGSPKLQFAVQHLPVHSQDGSTTSKVTIDGNILLNYGYVVDGDSNILDNPTLNGTRLVGMYMVNNVGNAAATLDSWSGSYQAPGSTEAQSGLPDGLSIQFPQVGQGVDLTSVMTQGTVITVAGGNQLETVWTLTKPPLGTTVGTITMKSSSQHISLTLKYSIEAYKGSGRQPLQPGGQPFNPGQEPIIVHRVPYEAATSTLRSIRVLALVLIGVVVFLGALYLIIRWRRAPNAYPRASPMFQVLESVNNADGPDVYPRASPMLNVYPTSSR